MRCAFVGAITVVVMLGPVPVGLGVAGQDAADGVVGESYVVVLNSDRLGEVVAEHGSRAEVEVRHVYRHALRGYAARMGDRAVATVRDDPRVAYVDPDRRVHLHTREAARLNREPQAGVPAGAASPQADETVSDEGGQTVPWGVERVGAVRAHRDGRTGEQVHTYVLDTGIDGDHSDLGVEGGHAVVRCQPEDCSADYDDDNGHGTHVAGTVAALDNERDVVGVAPDTTLWAVKVLNGAGVGRRSDVIRGIDWVAGETAKRGEPSVANMSFGGAGAKTGTCSGDGFTGQDSFHEAVCNAKNAGVVFTASAGNDGADAANHVPAAYDDAVLTASAVAQPSLQAEDERVHPPLRVNGWPVWSNWGDDHADWTDSPSAPVALAAPGVRVESTQRGGDTTTKSGTSMAAPHLAGGAALELQANPQSADGRAFSRARGNLLAGAEPTDTATWVNPSGNPHEESFLCVGSALNDRADCRPPSHTPAD